MNDSKESRKFQIQNWLQWRLGTKLWTMCVILLIVYAAFFGYAYFAQHLNLLDLGQLGLNKYSKNPSEVLRNIIWAYGLLIGGGFAVLGFVNSIHRTHQKDLELATARRIADTADAEIFVQSVEHLGHNEMAIRLGGLYSLENLARSAQALPLDVDNQAYLNSLLETLAAFVRMRAVIPPDTDNNNDDKVATDIEAAVRIISRTFKYKLRNAIKATRVDLRNCYLPRLEMPVGADMRQFNLTLTWLRNASLNGADLTEALIMQANLALAGFDGTNLTNASLPKSNLTKARLVRANLTAANLDETNLSDAFVDIAILTNAWLTDVQNWTPNQFLKALWNPDMPPQTLQSNNSEELNTAINSRTRIIQENGLWNIYLKELKAK